MADHKPRLLDLFCGAGGAARGYQQAGFYVVGVDLKPQPRYCGDEFHQADAMTYPLDGYDFVHASPPCQGYSIMRNLPWLRDRQYPLLIEPVRERLEASGLPYVIENVAGARRILNGGWLCGQMFGLPFYRHRHFASNWEWMAPGHPRHQRTTLTNDVLLAMNRRRGGDAYKTAGHGISQWQGDAAQKKGVGLGHAAGWRIAAAAMGIDWMDRDGLTQAIPPAYAAYIGEAWLRGQS